jgi:hypothetical protein
MSANTFLGCLTWTTSQQDQIDRLQDMKLTSFLPQDLRSAVDRSYHECSDAQSHVDYKISQSINNVEKAAGAKLDNSSNLPSSLFPARHGVLPSCSSDLLKQPLTYPTAALSSPLIRLSCFRQAHCLYMLCLGQWGACS